jgi:hypothetical protein
MVLATIGWPGLLAAVEAGRAEVDPRSPPKGADVCGPDERWQTSSLIGKAGPGFALRALGIRSLWNQNKIPPRTAKLLSNPAIALPLTSGLKISGRFPKTATRKM